jgi:hypothetical protein
MMKEIYMAADQVLSFVGSDVRDVEAGLAFVEFLNRNMAGKQRLDFVRHWKYEKYWRAIANLWSQEYWRRVWIVQEIVVASDVTVYFGHRSIGWDKISKLSKKLIALSEKVYLPRHVSTIRTSMPTMLVQLRESSVVNSLNRI